MSLFVLENTVGIETNINSNIVSSKNIGGVVEEKVVIVGLDHKTETGWEFSVGNSDLTINRLRFLNLGEFSTTRRINLWDVEAEKLISTTVARAGQFSWGYGEIEPITLKRNKNYVISIGAYRYSVYTRNISSDVKFDTNKISFIKPRYISEQLDVFPTIDNSTKLYALPDIVIASSIINDKVGLDIYVDETHVFKKVFEDNVTANLVADSSRHVIFNDSVGLDISVQSDKVKILFEEAKLNDLVEVSNNYVNRDEVFFNHLVDSHLLKSVMNTWEEHRFDFYNGTLNNVIVTDQGLELEHWNTKTFFEDFNADNDSEMFSIFTRVNGDWERVFFDNDRGYIYRSKEINNNQTSAVYFEFTTPINSVDVNISFDYFVSSEQDYDRFTVLIDGQPTILTGDLGWQNYNGLSESGYHRAEFIYRKDSHGEDYLDRASIDRFMYSYAFLKPHGYRISNPINLSEIKTLQTTKISWDDFVPEDEESKLEIEISLNNGLTWTKVENGKSIPGLNVGDDLTGKYLILKQNLYTPFNKSPILKDLKIEMLGFVMQN